MNAIDISLGTPRYCICQTIVTPALHNYKGVGTACFCEQGSTRLDGKIDEGYTRRMAGVSVAARKYARPEFLLPKLTQSAYVRWLHRKAVAHSKRDRKRGNRTLTNDAYKIAIHRAVCKSRGVDAYTGEYLAWELVSKYDNAESKAGRRVYKAKFVLLPTVDHVGDGLGVPNFRICAWRTNDAKSDMTLEEFVGLCRKVVAAHGLRIR